MPVYGETVKLQWGNERAPAKKTANAPSALRFVKPQTGATKPANAVIRLAAYEAEAPRLTNGREAQSETRSVVVNRDETAGDIRSAQLPPANTGTGPATDSNSQVQDGLRSPFGDTPGEPAPLNTPPMPDTDTPPVPESDSTLPSPDNNPLRSNQQQPAGNQPIENQLPATPPATGQFQPVLPAGPPEPEQAPLQVPEPSPTAVKAEGEKAQESCSKSLDNLRAYTVDKVNLSISIAGTAGEDYPFECSIDDGTMHSDRCWEQTTYMWKASAMCHKPLYFEDEQLERYGHSFSPCFQPFISGAHFFCTLPVLPYCMGVEPPCECIYALGHYRPGNCAPYMCNPIPLSCRGALFEAGAVTGAAIALP